MEIKCPKCHSDNPSDSKYCKECATPLLPSEEIAVTETLERPKEELTSGLTFAGRYQIIEELGKGGMGKIYRVIDKKLNEEVALKLIKPEIASDKKTIERFSNELKFARKIVHKNVGRMYEFMEEKGMHFITMEYVPGEDLKSFIRRSGQLTIGKSIFIAKQICEGLAEAHELGVIHRDLKPSNIMIDKEGNARIMDFGIARSVEVKGVTEAGMIIGTPEYMSPEQVEGEEADKRSDIYSLGVILYEMVTGRVPFGGKTPYSIALKHKSEAPQEPKVFNAQVPSDLNHVILRCMEKDKVRRYQGAEELLSDLTKIEEGIPTAERVIPKRKPLTSMEISVQFKLKKLLIPALVVIALAVVGVAIWRLIPKKGAVSLTSGKPSLAVMYFENRSDEPDLDKNLVDMLTRNLSRYKEIEVVSSQRLFDILKQIGKQDAESIDKKVATEVANRAEVKTMLVGSIIKIGNRIRIISELSDAQTGAIIGSEQAEGTSVNDVFDMVDELTVKLGVRLGVSTGEKGQPLKIADVTTNSYEAYDYFLKGREEYEKMLNAEARKFFKKAVELDPTFAVAYLYLARSVRGKAREEAYEKAKMYSERATEKERLYIEAAYASAVERDPEKKFRILKQMAKEYPKEKRVHFELAGYYGGKGLDDKAIEELNKALELDPNYGLALNLLALGYTSMGDFEKAIEYFNRYISVSPKDANPLDSMALCYFWMGRLEEAVAHYKEALEIKPDWFPSCWALSYIYALKENYLEAMKWVDRGIDMAPSPVERAQGFLLKGFFYFWLGRLEQSLRELGTVSDLAESLGDNYRQSFAGWMAGWVYYERGELELARRSWKSSFDIYDNKAEYTLCLGAADVKEGRIDSAKSRLAEVKSLLLEMSLSINKEFFKFRYDSLREEVLLAEGSLDEAIAVGKRLLALPQPTYGYIVSLNLPSRNDVLARCYRQKGKLDKAIAEYEQLITFYPKSKSQHLIRPKYHYQLARLCEEKGWEGKAIEQYEKFLEIWEDADEGLPEKADAKKRLSALKEK